MLNNTIIRRVKARVPSNNTGLSKIITYIVVFICNYETVESALAFRPIKEKWLALYLEPYKWNTR